MSEVYAVRRGLLRDRCAAVGSAAALVSRPANVRYLAGGAPPGAVLLLGPDEDVLLCPRAPTGEPDHGHTDDQLRLALLPPPAAKTRRSPQPTWPPPPARNRWPSRNTI